MNDEFLSESCTLFFTSESEGKARLSEQTDKEVALERRRLEIHGDPLEKMRDMLQLEWGRREVAIMERCQGILSEFTSQRELAQ